MLSKIEVAHIPRDLSVYIGLYTEVTNAAFLRKQLLDQNAEFEFAFLDAASVLSTTHLLAAIFRAINDRANGRMKSRNVHSEIVFALSPNNNIADAYRKFGITETTTDLLVVKVAASESGPERAAFQKTIAQSLEGRLLEFTDANLAAVADEGRIRKTYKLPAGGSKSGGKAAQTSRTAEDRLEQRRELEVCVLGLMALRGAT